MRGRNHWERGPFEEGQWTRRCCKLRRHGKTQQNCWRYSYRLLDDRIENVRTLHEYLGLYVPLDYICVGLGHCRLGSAMSDYRLTYDWTTTDNTRAYKHHTDCRTKGKRRHILRVPSMNSHPWTTRIDLWKSLCLHFGSRNSLYCKLRGNLSTNYCCLTSRFIGLNN